MPQANDANLIHVSIRAFGGLIEELDPDISGGTHQFDVIVEGEAGSVRANNGSPYTLTLTAFDWTAGQSAALSIGAYMNPATLAAPLIQTFNSTIGTVLGTLDSDGNPNIAGASCSNAWPAYEQKFTITIPAADVGLAAGHVLQYTAFLQAKGSDPIDSIAQSPLFVLV